MNIDLAYLNLLSAVLFRCHLSSAKNAVIAGGAIRDMLLDKEIADIDVFFSGPINKFSLTALFDKVEECGNGLYEDSSFNVLYKITDKILPVPIQIIQVEGDVKEHISKFPTPLSRVSYSEETAIQGLTKQFIQNAYYKTVVFDKPVNYQYLYKMKQKFPDWKITFTLPEYNPAFVTEALDS